MQETDLDHRLNFDSLPSLTSLVDETFSTAEAAETLEIYDKNGKLNASYLLRNAKILLTAEDYELAKTIFQSLIEHGESLGAAYAGLGVCYERENRFDLAIKAYKEAIIYEPSYTSLIALADLFIRQQDYKNAIGTLLRANHLPRIRKKESFEILKNLGSCYLRMDQLDHAEINYQKAHEITPDSDAIHVNIGCLSLKKKGVPNAILHFNAAINLNPKNFRAYTGLGLAHILRNEKRLAHDALAKSLGLNINNLTAIYYLIKCAYEICHYSTCIDMLSKYIDSNPFNNNILFSFAGLQYLQGEYDCCTLTCEKILSAKPDHIGANKLKKLIDIKVNN